MGTRLFPYLVGNSIRIAVFHLFMLCLISACAVGLLQSFVIKDQISQSFGALSEGFGGFTISEQGIIPLKNNTQPKSVAVNDGLRIDYFPDRTSIKVDKLKRTLKSRGVVYSPDFIFMWEKKDKLFQVLPLLSSLKVMEDYNEKTLGYDELASFVKLVAEDSAVVYIFGNNEQSYADFALQLNEALGKELSFNFSEYEISILVLVVIVAFVASFIGIFVISIFYCLLFTALFLTFNKRTFGDLSFKTMFVLCIYTAFPAVIIAALVTAYGLIDYSTVFVVVFLIYFFNVLKSIFKPLGED